MTFNHNYAVFSFLNKDLQWSVLTIHGGYLFKSLECFHRCLNMFCFVHHWKNKLKLDWVHISADSKTYLVSLIPSLVFKANVYFYIKMLSKFHALFFSKTYLRDNLGPRLLCLFEVKDSDNFLLQSFRSKKQRSLS